MSKVASSALQVGLVSYEPLVEYLEGPDLPHAASGDLDHRELPNVTNGALKLSAGRKKALDSLPLSK